MRFWYHASKHAVKVSCADRARSFPFPFPGPATSFIIYMRAMRITTSTRLLSAGTLTWCVLAGGCGDRSVDLPEGGASIHVLFDERHGLEGGELVRLHEFDIGFVEAVDLARSRVRATISLSPEALANLTDATTFTVEDDGGGLYLETHVIDPDAQALDDGASVEGADGSLELLSMRASKMAGELADDARASEWWRKTSEFIDDVRKDLQGTDGTEEERELQREWEAILEQMAQAAEDGEEELARRVDELVKRLEEAGRSDQARELEKRFEELQNDLPER